MPDVNVLIADDHLATIDEVAAALRDAGLRGAQVLPSAGVVTGAVDDAAVSALEAVDGVAKVETATEIRLPPPDEPVQ